MAESGLLPPMDVIYASDLVQSSSNDSYEVEDVETVEVIDAVETGEEIESADAGEAAEPAQDDVATGEEPAAKA